MLTIFANKKNFAFQKLKILWLGTFFIKLNYNEPTHENFLKFTLLFLW